MLIVNSKEPRMKKYRLVTRCVAFGLILGISALLTGCSTTPSLSSGSSSSLSSGSSDQQPDLAGKWAWSQETQAPLPPHVWQGEFVLEEEGDSYRGELNDSSEGTYGDTIKDVTVVNDQISFTRQGRWGVQQWKGTLKKEDGDLKVVDGQWTKGGIAGIWSAHKID
jgi:hypothetical protein